MKKLFFLSLSFLLLSFFCNANNTKSELKHTKPESVGMRSERLILADSVINKAIANKEIPGAVLAVVRNDKIVYLKAYGNRAVVPDTIPMTTNTVFDLASVSKCVGTTLSFMQLVEDGKVRIADNVSRYIPGFKPWVDPQTGKAEEITVKHLLTHSSGLLPYVDMNSFVAKYGENCPDSLMKHIALEIKRSFRPGTDFQYSCLNFVTLQNIIQNVTGEKLCDYAQSHVFDVLGLKNTCYNPTGKILDMCAPTTVQEDGKPLWGIVHDPIAWKLNLGNSGNAGVFSNAEDLAIIAAAIFNGGEINGKRILSPLTVKTMTTIPADIDPKVGRALGWDAFSDYSGNKGDLFDRRNTIGHTGYTGTEMILDLEHKVAVIFLSNRVHPVDKGSVTRLRALVANIIASSIEK